MRVNIQFYKCLARVRRVSACERRVDIRIFSSFSRGSPYKPWSIFTLWHHESAQTLAEAVKCRRQILFPVVTMLNLDRRVDLSAVTVAPVNLHNSGRIAHDQT